MPEETVNFIERETDKLTTHEGVPFTVSILLQSRFRKDGTKGNLYPFSALLLYKD